MATSAPTMSALTTSVPAWMPDRRRQRDVRAELWPQDGDPAQRQPQLPRLAQLDAGHDVERLEVEVGLVEAVEQHQPVGAGVDDARREVGHGRVVRAELHRERDVELGAHRGDELEVGGLDVGGAARGSAATWYRFSSTASAPASCDAAARSGPTRRCVSR